MTLTYIARTTFRNKGILFGIKPRDRLSHVYIIGKTGTGKSTLLRVMVEQDIKLGLGVALFDPHGDLVDAVFQSIPEHRKPDLLYLNTPDSECVWHFNPLADVPVGKEALAVAGIVEVFEKLWSRDWGPRLEHLLRNVTFTLLEVPGTTLAHIPRLLSDVRWRESLIPRLTNRVVAHFWTREYAGYSYRFRAVVTAPLLNKVGAFLTDPLLRRILSGKKSSFNLREVMDSGKILLVNLAKGRIGEGPAHLLGSLLVSSLSLAGLSRADVVEEERRDFHVYLDEFHSFSTLSFATMLAELRKYHVGLVLTNQYLSQLDRGVRDAVLGNAGTLISFRVGAVDAPLIAAELSPKFEADDLIHLPNYHIYLKLMIDGQPSSPFSGVTIELLLPKSL